MSTTEAQPSGLDPMKQAEPQAEHRWLEKLLGEWTFEGECPVTDGDPQQKFNGVETVRSLGGLWIVAEGHGPMPDGDEAYTMMTLGYDPQKDRYVGTWVGSMMTHLWVYDGEMGAAQEELTLHCNGPSMTGSGEMRKFKDVIKIIDGNNRTLTGYMLGDNGEWQELMTARYRRK